MCQRYPQCICKWSCSWFHNCRRSTGTCRAHPDQVERTVGDTSPHTPHSRMMAHPSASSCNKHTCQWMVTKQNKHKMSPYCSCGTAHRLLQMYWIWLKRCFPLTHRERFVNWRSSPILTSAHRWVDIEWIFIFGWTIALTLGKLIPFSNWDWSKVSTAFWCR